MLFYVTLYQTKHNQKEESCTYHNICLPLSKGIKIQQYFLATQCDDGKNITKEVSKNFSEGLSCMLSSLYGHTTNNVLSSAMARKLLSHISIFQFSNEFINIPLVYLLNCLSRNE